MTVFAYIAVGALLIHFVMYLGDREKELDEIEDVDEDEFVSR